MILIMKYGISMLLICLSVSGCTTIELTAEMYKRCITETTKECPVDFEKWM